MRMAPDVGIRRTECLYPVRERTTSPAIACPLLSRLIGRWAACSASCNPPPSLVASAGWHNSGCNMKAGESVLSLLAFATWVALASVDARAAVTKASGPVLIAQVRDAEGRFLVVERGGVPFGVYATLYEGDPRRTAFARALDAAPYARVDLELILAARRYHAKGAAVPDGLDTVQWRRAVEDPVFVAVEGMFEENHWQGFVLRTGNGDEDHLLTTFVATVASAEQMVEPWFMSSLFVHEAAHAALHVASAPWLTRPWGRLVAAIGFGGDPTDTARLRSAFHDTQRTSTRLIAIDEGFAETLGAIAELAKPMREVEAWKLDSSTSLSTARKYQGPRQRNELIRWNRLVFEPRLPPEDVVTRDGVQTALAWFRQSLPRDNHRLRSCGAQLSTEGVIATILLRLASDKALQDAPMPARVLERLAPPGREATLWLAGLQPESRVLLRVIVALAEIEAAGSQLATFDIGLPELVASWVELFPGDAQSLVQAVVMTTFGATVSVSLADRIRRLLADPEVIPPRDPKASEVAALADALRAATAVGDAGKLFAACGPALWVRVEGKTICSDFGGGCLAFDVDLNAAEEMDLRMFPGIGGAKAHEIVAQRDNAGPFQTYAEFFDTVGVSEIDRAAVRLVPSAGDLK